VDTAAVARAITTGAVAPEALGSLIQPQKPTVMPDEPLRAELRSFLDAVRNRTKPVVSLEDGRRALGVALDILTAIREHNKRVRMDTLWASRT
jgi:predicted dehydrogenase